MKPTILLAAIAAAALSAPNAPAAKPSKQDKFETRAASATCPTTSAEILILGTSHFSNPGLDAQNVQVDDVLAPRRQREIEEVAHRLIAFKPTKVMVEAPYRDYSTLVAYRNYLLGKHSLSDNETEQLGFRIAKMAGLKQVTPIDFEMRMSGFRPDELDDNWHPKSEAQANASAPAAATTALTEEQRLLQTGTIRQYLLYLNSPAYAEKSHAGYMENFRPLDSPVLYEHADYLANWYKRNIRMFANIVRETNFPQDHVLVIVGSGHLRILKDFAQTASYFCSISPIDYLK